MPLALITGASTGIGRATALRLAADGWTVLAGVRREADGERLLDDAGEGGRVVPVTLDVTEPEQAREAAARAAELSEQGRASVRGGLDALVNNAGIGVGGPLELISPEQLRVQFDVNVLGQVAVTQALLPLLRTARGRLVFISSIGGLVATPYLAPYAASKHAVEALGDSLRLELRSSGIQVALVEPGSVTTPIWEKGKAEARSVQIPAELQQQYGHVPAAMEKTLEDTERRGVPPERVADTIAVALRSPRMRTRYLVGRDARIMLAIKRVLPDRVFDRMISRALGV